MEFKDEDIRINVRKARAPRLTVILLDSSGSMGLQKRISIAKGIAKKLVENSYQRRDWLSLIVFRGNEAEVVMKPTKKYETNIRFNRPHSNRWKDSTTFCTSEVDLCCQQHKEC
uniref:VWA domain-containing protein n=1 Tax=Archaeoglobus fulgidus TaxID=2234 RepID=A0A7J2TKB7_ARCFL